MDGTHTFTENQIEKFDVGMFLKTLETQYVI